MSLLFYKEVGIVVVYIGIAKAVIVVVYIGIAKAVIVKSSVISSK